MKILILRHLESEKNKNKAFSSIYDSEQLTTKGRIKGTSIAKDIKAYVESESLKVNNIYCANSIRSIMTAQYITNALKVGIKSYDELRSNNSGSLLGKNEKEALIENPLFMKQLKLFRSGLYSSYDFVKVHEREDKRDFELRVNTCINSILKDESEDLKIFVLHHSSLTAVMINFARTYYNYPVNFYGRVDCDLGNIYLIDSEQIILCNSPTKDLIKVLR